MGSYVYSSQEGAKDKKTNNNRIIGRVRFPDPVPVSGQGRVPSVCQVCQCGYLAFLFIGGSRARP